MKPTMKRLPKFPCRECKSAVKNSQHAISCDTCHQWFHKKCLSMCDYVFNCYTQNDELEWIYANYGLLEVSFNALQDSGRKVDVQDDLPRNRHKQKQNQLKMFAV